jgi:hypothetical protein
MKFLHILKGAVLEGTVCTITMRIVPTLNEQDVTSLSTVLEKLHPILDSELRRSVTDSLGLTFSIRELIFRDATAEIFIAIHTTPYKLHSYPTFTGALRSLVLHLCNILNLHVGEQSEQLRVEGEWAPAPPLIRLRLDKLSQHDSLLYRLQQPLSVLVLATLFGSILIPYFNDTENRRKLRHEERVKIAISILDQSQETDRRMDSMMQYLTLFRKDHKDPRSTKDELKEGQRIARNDFNKLFFLYNEQAWWWPWNVWHKGSLAALATPDESQQILGMVQEYLNALNEGSQAFPVLWDPFLKDAYRPDDPKNDQLIEQAKRTMEKGRVRRNDIALNMAKIFAAH